VEKGLILKAVANIDTEEVKAGLANFCKPVMEGIRELKGEIAMGQHLYYLQVLAG
jgi:putative component of toxin-antitoxin plasmid stabilization module